MIYVIDNTDFPFSVNLNFSEVVVECLASQKVRFRFATSAFIF